MQMVKNTFNQKLI